jgi:hypothetical protein
VSPAGRSILNGLLHKDPTVRLGAKLGALEIKEHPFFDAFDWEAL